MSSSGLARAHCFVHEERAATARCLSCREFYCGECITEHSGKLICASCLASASAERKKEEKGGASVLPGAIVQLFLAIIICWATYYYFARFLGDIPDQFHDGTIWE